MNRAFCQRATIELGPSRRQEPRAGQGASAEAYCPYGGSASNAGRRRGSERRRRESSIVALSALILSFVGVGCGVGKTVGTQPDVPHVIETQPVDPKKEAEEAAKRAAAKAAHVATFNRALSEMMSADEKDAWTEEACEKVPAGFLATAEVKEDGLNVKSIFNAGVAYERCHKDDEAKKQFGRALALAPDFHPAKVHLILMRHRENGGKEVDKTISELRHVAIVDARYQNVEALVSLAMLSLDRNSEVADTDGANDRARAVRYLQSALAVDDGYAPAMNGLALYYLGEARLSAGRKSARGAMSSQVQGQAKTTQAMELAALVCSQAIRKDPSDALIHNTYGLIQVELGNLGKAAEAFGKARALRPGFYEAEMNFAAVNLQFRGFAKAEEAYRAVIKSRPDDYDARIGLALALRGQIQDANADKLVPEAAKELERAKKISPNRPEAYFNEGILTQEYKARGTGAGLKGQIATAQDLFQQFIQKAGKNAEYADAVKQAGERIKEMDEILKFMDAAKSGT